MHFLRAEAFLWGLAVACGKASPPAFPTITAYVPQNAADRVVGPMLDIAARHHWALSIRTDSTARAEVDLMVLDRNGRLAAHLRPDSRAAVEARELALALRLPLQ